MNITKVISTELDDLKRRIVKILRLGKDDVQTSMQAAPYGIDSNPIEDMIAIYDKPGTRGKTVVVGYLNKEQLAELGELRVYSTDDAGALQFYIHLKNAAADGFCQIGGKEDNMVRFSKLDEGFKLLVKDFDDFVNLTYKVHAHTFSVGNQAGDLFDTGAPVISKHVNGTAAKIDDAKIEDIRTYKVGGPEL